MPNPSNKVLAYLEYAAVRSIFFLLGVWPLRTAARLGATMGVVTRGIFSNRLGIAKTNVTLALPELTEDERAAIVRGCFASNGRLIAATCVLQHGDQERAKALFRVEGIEYFNAARETGKAVFLLGAHFGGWECFVTAAPLICGPVNFVFRPPNNRLIAQLIARFRSRFGTKLVARGSGARAKIAELIEANETIIHLPDVNWHERGGAYVDFFGMQASTSISLAEFVIDGGAVVVPTFAIWSEEERRYVVEFQPALDLAVSGDRDKDIVAITQATTTVIEGIIRRYPDQWQWFHRRWNTRPSGETSLYKS